MGQEQHTPGPLWIIMDKKKKKPVLSASGACIQIVCSDTTGNPMYPHRCVALIPTLARREGRRGLHTIETALDDAELFTQAPDLLAEVKRLREQLTQLAKWVMAADDDGNIRHEPTATRLLSKARAALKKGA